MRETQGAQWVPVNSEKNTVQRRRDRLVLTQGQLAAEAGVNRDTVGAIEAGGGSPRSKRKVATALERLEDEAGLPPIDEEPAPPATAPEPLPQQPQVVRFIVEGVYGAKALIVEVPPDNVAELEAAVDRIMRNLRGGAAQS